MPPKLQIQIFIKTQTIRYYRVISRVVTALGYFASDHDIYLPKITFTMKNIKKMQDINQEE